MDYALGADAAELRNHLRDLIADHVPPDFLGEFTEDPDGPAVVERFAALLADERLLTLNWPAEYGGADASVWTVAALREEMWAHHEPRGAHYMGLNWVGPAILRHGTAAQRARYLPAIADGRAVWCQGFSEPEAGSDLASLRTRATRVHGGWSVTGQKVWTSLAHWAQVRIGKNGLPSRRSVPRSDASALAEPAAWARAAMPARGSASRQSKTPEAARGRRTWRDPKAPPGR